MTDAMPQPFDVKLMNLAATALFVAFVVLALAALAWWTLRLPVFAIAGITVQGDVSHNNAITLRANVAPRLAGNFFTMNLAKSRTVFEEVPWVRQAVVRREFPNRLRVLLQEHKAVAFWGSDGESKLVNSYGEVFEANVGDVEHEELPRLAGPLDQAAQVLEMYRVLKPIFETLDLTVDQVTLSASGSWQVELDTGAAIELGRGADQEVVARTQQFTRTLTQVASRYARRPEALLSADLRHADGYAVRLRGVATVVSDGKK